MYLCKIWIMIIINISRSIYYNDICEIYVYNLHIGKVYIDMYIRTGYTICTLQWCFRPQTQATQGFSQLTGLTDDVQNIPCHPWSLYASNLLLRKSKETWWHLWWSKYSKSYITVEWNSKQHRLLEISKIPQLTPTTCPLPQSIYLFPLNLLCR